MNDDLAKRLREGAEELRDIPGGIGRLIDLMEEAASYLESIKNIVVKTAAAFPSDVVESVHGPFDSEEEAVNWIPEDDEGYFYTVQEMKHVNER
jgi:hypothetical protein